MKNTVIKELVEFINENQDEQITETQVIKELLKFNNDYYDVDNVDVDNQLKNDLDNLVADHVDFEDFRFNKNMKKTEFKEEIADTLDEYYYELHKFLTNSDLFKENNIDDQSVVYHNMKDKFIYSNKELGDNTFFKENIKAFKDMLNEKDEMLILNDNIANRLGYEENVEILAETMKDNEYVSGGNIELWHGKYGIESNVVENVDDLLDYMQLGKYDYFRILLNKNTNNLTFELSHHDGVHVIYLKPLTKEGIEFYDDSMDNIDAIENYTWLSGHELDKHDIAKILYNTPKYSNSFNVDEKSIEQEVELINKYKSQPSRDLE